MKSYILDVLGRHIRPWRYPDEPALPVFDLFPRSARFWASIRRSLERAVGRW